MISQPALYGVAADPLTLVNLNAVVVSDVHRTKAGQVRRKLAWDVLELYNDAVRAVGRERDVLVIDAASRLPKSSQLFYDFVHFTNERRLESLRALCPKIPSARFSRSASLISQLVGPCPEIEPLDSGWDETIQDRNQLDGTMEGRQAPVSLAVNGVYSDMAIETGLVVRMVYALAYRQTEGFLHSIASLVEDSV